MLPAYNLVLTCLHAYVLALSCSSLVAASSSIIVFSARDCSARVSIFFTSSFAAAAPLKSFCDTSPLIIFFLALLTLIAFHWHSIELNCAEIKQPEAKDNYWEAQCHGTKIRKQQLAQIVSANLSLDNKTRIQALNGERQLLRSTALQRVSTPKGES